MYKRKRTPSRLSSRKKSRRSASRPARRRTAYRSIRGRGRHIKRTEIFRYNKYSNPHISAPAVIARQHLLNMHTADKDNDDGTWDLYKAILEGSTAVAGAVVGSYTNLGAINGAYIANNVYNGAKNVYDAVNGPVNKRNFVPVNDAGQPLQPPPVTNNLGGSHHPPNVQTPSWYNSYESMFPWISGQQPDLRTYHGEL